MLGRDPEVASGFRRTSGLQHVAPGFSRTSLALAIAVVAVVFDATAARAQTTSQIPLQFDFLTPGARSMAMGGAFIAAADDVTAAFTNPAGLDSLPGRRREVTVEGRFRRFETPFLARGRVSGSITGFGLDVLPNPVYEDDVDTSAGPTFAAALLPLSAGTLTLYGHQLMRADNAFASDGVFQRVTFAGTTDDRARELPVRGSRRAHIVSAGAVYSRQLTDRFAFGGGISVARLSLDADFARHSVESLFGPVLDDKISATATQDASDISVGFNAGVQVVVTGQIRVGATFRRGASFSFHQEDRVPDEQRETIRDGRFKVPDVFGAGIEWRAREALRVLFDYDYVRYSELKRDFIDFQAISSGRASQVLVDDAHEWHAGLEYQYLRPDRRPLAFRGGVWRDPAHAPRYVSTPAFDAVDELLLATLPGVPGVTHVTFGAGVLVRGVEINGAVDRSSRTLQTALSANLRF